MARIWSVCQNLAVLCQISASLAKIRPKWPNFSHLHHKLVRPESGHLRRNPTNLDSDKTGKNLAIVAGILSASDGISSPVFFVVSDFFVRAKHQKVFSRKSFFFLKNNFIENILRGKILFSHSIWIEFSIPELKFG